MIRYFLITCTAVWLVAVLAFTCRPSEPPADLRYVNPSGIHTLDPARMSWTQDFRVALNIWEGLTTWDPNTLAPLPAASDQPPQVSADGSIYSFALRRNGRWSNGDPVTAVDFARGWRRAIEPGTAADYAFLITDHIRGAAEYVARRHQAVTALTALKRLADGWDLTPQRACDLTTSSLLLLLQTMGVHCPAANGDDEGSCRSVQECLTAAEVDWRALHERALRDHAASLDSMFAGVGIEVRGDWELVIHLTQPCPYLPDLLALPVFLPLHESIERLRVREGDVPLSPEGLVIYDPQWTKPDYHRADYPGLTTNGPYRLDSWVFKQRARMVVNAYHRGAGEISCRAVDMLVMENVSAALMAYEAGDVDFLPAMDVPYDHEIARLAQSGRRLDFHLCQVSATYFLNFNCVSDTVRGRINPFRDARVRKAFARSIDKRAIVEQVLRRGDRVAESFVPADVMPGYDPPNGLSSDAAEARRLLADAGYSDGSVTPTVDFLYLPADERVAQALARRWRETLGVRVELRSMESKTFAEDIADHRFMIARGNWYADYNDPTTYLNCLTTGNGNNDSGYANPEFDRLLMEANAAANPSTRMALLAKAERMIVQDDVPIWPLLHYALPVAIKPHVQGLHPNARLWFPFRHVTVRR